MQKEESVNSQSNQPITKDFIAKSEQNSNKEIKAKENEEKSAKRSRAQIMLSERQNFSCIEGSNHRYYLEQFYIPQTDLSIQSNPEDKEELFTLRFDSSSTHIAGGYSSGRVGIFDIKENKYVFTTISEFPITCLRWKPYAKTTLLAVSADGNITQLHSTSGKILQKIEEEKNHIMCVDYSPDGALFSTGGNDKIVRLYDDNTKTLISTLDTLFYQIPKHDNRIFSVKFNPNDLNMLISGGWDNTLKIYDIRQKGITKSLYGPHICGDGIDIKGTMILTASWEKRDQIQMWDLRKNEIANVLQIDYPSIKKATYLYSCKFNYQRKIFGVTGSNLNTIRVYRYENDINNKNEDFVLESHCSELESPCYAIDFSEPGNQMAYGCADSMIRLVSIKQ